LLANAYSWSPAEVRDLTDVEVAYYYKYLPMVEARRAYPVAQLNADLREFAFPRYTEESDQSKEPPKPRTPWTVEELLPPFAWFERDDMTLAQAKSLVDAFDRLPAWAQGCVPIDAARALLPD